MFTSYRTGPPVENYLNQRHTSIFMGFRDHQRRPMCNISFPTPSHQLSHQAMLIQKKKNIQSLALITFVLATKTEHYFVLPCFKTAVTVQNATNNGVYMKEQAQPSMDPIT